MDSMPTSHNVSFRVDDISFNYQQNYYWKEYFHAASWSTTLIFCVCISRSLEKLFTIITKLNIQFGFNQSEKPTSIILICRRHSLYSIPFELLRNFTGQLTLSSFMSKLFWWRYTSSFPILRTDWFRFHPKASDKAKDWGTLIRTEHPVFQSRP